ncbi:SUKH-3 domain-containing protein [Hymenobacter sp. H14-R3]|uniref:SUKH-3 domain-containing protein n=1 Tax=Hymenobacter sp. H14-R3 TaxID=3046308 RepID=UPI0024BA5719|nr:SUKH-3 domain-containing protein [Hymenobacter sp. H14-R3]MDJ0365266.1 SUKH-3 domain-containing protein [Hymenobacter sp. H14-R3]
MDNQLSFSPTVQAILEQAGWYKGRNAAGTFPLPHDVVYSDAIMLILNEFGGLYLRSNGPGITLSRFSIDFDPMDADFESSEDGIIYYYASLIAKKLYPLGFIPTESLMLCIDENFCMYKVGDNLHYAGDSFAEGVSNILLGIRGKTLNEQTLEWE